MKEKPYFNNRISRYAESPLFKTPVDVEDDDLDTIAMQDLLEDPLKYNGTETLISDNNNLQGNLANNVDGICLPGRNIDVTKTENWYKANSEKPDEPSGDKLTGQGMTRESNNSKVDYLYQCPIIKTTDETGRGDYFYKRK